MPEKINNEFVFPANLALAIEEESSFSEQQKSDAYAALCRYLIFGTEPEDITLRMFCKAIKISIDNEKQRKKELSEKRRAAILTRWNKKDDEIKTENEIIEPKIVKTENEFMSLTDDVDIQNALSDPESSLNFFLATGSGYDELTVAEREFADRGNVRSKCLWHKELQAAAKAVKRKAFSAPTLEEWLDFCREKNLNLNKMRDAYESYVVADWHDSQGNPIRNWKQKILQVWTRNPDNYNTQSANFSNNKPSAFQEMCEASEVAKKILEQKGLL